jgi:mycothiol system anti-sigma-R factor
VSARPDCSAECQEALQQLERFLDGELPNDRVHEVKQHLTDCYPCTDRATFEEQLRAIVRRECVEHAPPQLLQSIRARLSTGAVVDD